MLLRGDAQHFIAAWFGVNPGRVAEIATGEHFAEVSPATHNDLPPPGRYLTPVEAFRITEAVSAARNALEQAERWLIRRHGT